MKAKCLFSIHPGGFVAGSPRLDDAQNRILVRHCGFEEVFACDYPKDNFEETISYLGATLRNLSKQFDIYVIGRSSGGYLAKVLFESYTHLIKKCIYLAPVFDPVKRQEVHPRFRERHRYYFRLTTHVPPTTRFDTQKEVIFLAERDQNIPLTCFTKLQQKHARTFNKTHEGLCFTTDARFLQRLCRLMLE